MEGVKGGKLNAHSKTHNETLNSYTHTHVYNSHSILKKCYSAISHLCCQNNDQNCRKAKRKIQTPLPQHRITSNLSKQ